MLARASKRKLRYHASLSKQINSSFQQLNLPWLCPAQLQWIARTSLATQAAAQDNPRARQSTSVATRHDTRSLATATDPHIPRPDSIPFLTNFALSTTNQARAVPSFSSIQTWDNFRPLVIHEQIAEPPPRAKRLRGIGGDATELFQNLHACIGVSRWDRAAAIVRRLADMFHPNAPELLEAHVVYLQALVYALCRGSHDVSLKKIQKWFEVEIRRNGIQPSPAIFALMCRASLNSLDGKPRSRTVRRYLHLAEEVGLLHDTISSGEFPLDEWQELGDIRNDLFAPILPKDITEECDYVELDPSNEPTPSKEYRLDDVPRVPIRPVEQKGLGLDTLKRSLMVINQPTVLHQDKFESAFRQDKDYAWNYARQEEMEENVVDAAMERWRKEHDQMLKMGINTSLRTKSMGALLWNWHTALLTEVRRELEDIKNAFENEDQQRSDDRLSYGPYFESVSAEKIAATTVVTTLELLVQQGISDGVWFGKLAKQIGARLVTEARGKVDGRNPKTRRWSNGTAQQRQQVLQRLYKGNTIFKEGNELLKASTETDALRHKSSEWPLAVKVQIGALLVARLLDVAKVDVPEDTGREGTKVPESAFKHEVKSWKGRPMGVINAHPTLIEKLMQEPPRYAVGAHLPMIVQPKPWTGFNEGGYLRYSTPIMRLKGNDEVQEMYAQAACEKGDLQQVCAGLDVLGKTGWRINQDVLRVILDAWNSGEAIANIPAENPDIPLPPEPDPSEGEKARAMWRMAVQTLENEKMGYHSQRCYFNLQLEIAQAFSNEVFYYPHNIDFRGRAYPISPYFNHMGADHTRGLLMFAKGKELGAVGLKWLKIHLANVFGYDKASLQEREDFATEHITDLYDSATNPLNGQKWWLKADDPWQCLATCFELKKAFDSPDPTKYVSHLPVHQDGTCNGLQHYAALGGDTFGAQQVNLEPGDRPADIYSGVANLVRAAIDRDAEEGNEIAKVLRTKITRKVVKQTVMTNVYGVTFVGARAQVQKQLDAIMRNRSECDIDNYQLAAYIAKKIFQALATMFQGAQAIQFWLGECANRISTAITAEQIAKIREQQGNAVATPDPKYKSKATKWSRPGRPSLKKDQVKSLFKSSVIWTTPLKLPVVQPYRNEKLHEIRTVLQSIKMRTPNPHDTVSRRKQLQGFPPNFIHSLDATHMLLSALKCDEIGLTFAAVHDSFWTHASDVAVMNRVLRDAFVKMHGEDIVGRLAAEFAARYGNAMYLAIVWSRSPTGMKIKALRASRSSTKAHAARKAGKQPLSLQERKKHQTQVHNKRVYLTQELMEEYERHEMLKSKDPEVRAKAEKIVTPASIFLSSDSSDLALPSELSDAALGAIPTEDASPDTDLFESAIGRDSLAAASEADSNAEPRTKTREQQIHVWVPLTFPEVPMRGDWDVSRLKESVYFFS